MSVTVADVRHVAAITRLGIPEERLEGLVHELNGILAHMEVLVRADVPPHVAADASARDHAAPAAMPLRSDDDAPDALARPIETLGAPMRDGFFIVPRLGTHARSGGEDAAAS